MKSGLEIIFDNDGKESIHSYEIKVKFSSINDKGNSKKIYKNGHYGFSDFSIEAYGYDKADVEECFLAHLENIINKLIELRSVKYPKETDRVEKK